MAKSNNNVVPLRPGKSNHQGEGGGKPRAFANAGELLQAFVDYTDSVIDNNYAELPTKRNFARWIGADVKTIYNTIYKYYPGDKKDYQQLLAEVLAQGASAGKYNVTMTIFCLKNWCEWSDKRESTNIQQRPKLVSKAEADKVIRDYISTSK